MKHPGLSPTPSAAPPPLSALLRGRWVGVVAVVALLHLGLLEWLSRHPQLGGGLAEMAEPEFNQSLTLGSVQPGTDTASHADTASAHPTPTVGQVVQARTVYAQPKPPPAPQPPKPPTPPPPRTRPTPAEPAAPAPAPLPTASPPAQATTAAATTAATATAADAPAAPDATANASTSDILGSSSSSGSRSGSGSNANPSVGPSLDAPAPQLAALSSPDAKPTTSTSTSTSTENIEQKGTSALTGKGLSATPIAPPSSQWLQVWPPSTRLSYSLRGYFRGDLYGSARVQWQRTGEQYQAQVAVNVGLFLDMRMTSQGRITPERLWPVAYQEDRRSKKRLVRMGEQQVVLDNGTTLPRPPALQDTASQFVQLSQDFASGRQALALGKVIQVTLARPGGVDAWTYDVAALDTLATAMGPVQAYHLRPRPLADAKGSVAVDMWFAPALRYQPARIRLTLNPETWLELTLESATQADVTEPTSTSAPTTPANRNPW